MEEVAVLQPTPDADLYVYLIDEKRAAQGNDIRHEFTPGVHTFTLRFRKKEIVSGKPIPHSGEFNLSIDAKVGKTYQIIHTKNNNYSKWSTYIVDVSNKNRVSSIMTNED